MRDFQLLTYLAIIVCQGIFIKNGIRKSRLKTMFKKRLFMGIPVNRGIVATVYSKLKEPLTREELAAIYQECYQDKPFVRIQASLPNLHQVVGTNYTDIGFDYNHVTNILTVVAVLDNLIKGAAGQAVQNMNLMLGFPETDGLLSQPSYV